MSNELEPTSNQMEPTFNWERIDSLMGRRLKLRADRTTPFPTIAPTDNIAQITRKVMNYVKKTNDPAELTDEQIADMCGMKLANMEEPLSSVISNDDFDKRIRRDFKLFGRQRIVWCRDNDDKPVAISTASTASKTGVFLFRDHRSIAFRVENLSQISVVAQYAHEFKQMFPEFTDKEVDNLARLLANKRYSGSKYEFLWAENMWDQNICRWTRKALELDVVQEGLERDGIKLSSPDPSEFSVIEMRYVWLNTPLDPELNECYAFSSSSRVNKSIIDRELNGEENWRARELNRCWRSFLETQIGMEYSAELERKYVRTNSPEHSATVWQEKRNIPQKYLDAASNSVFAASGDFRHVEIDSDVDLELFQGVEKEYETLRGSIGATKAPTLRWRKTGRHKALGVYHPHVDNIAVDPRHPSSFLHEYAHHLDYTVEGINLSNSEDFRPLLHRAQAMLRPLYDSVSRSRYQYFLTPTEIFARTSELYFFWRGVNTSLNGDVSKYDVTPYAEMIGLKDEIISYWDGLIEKLGGSIPTPENLAKTREAAQERPAALKPLSGGIEAPEQLIQQGMQGALFAKGAGADEVAFIHGRELLNAAGMGELAAALSDYSGSPADAAGNGGSPTANITHEANRRQTM